MTHTFLLGVRHFDNIPALTAHVDKSGQSVGFVSNHPGPLESLETASANKLNFDLFNAGVHL